jgi:tetratricopeptide (TPR) repeat protein
LTQAALAGDDFTTGFISLVETGRTRISLRAAEIFARRLGVSVSELMEPTTSGPTLEIELLAAERSLRSGEPAAALEAAERAARRAKGLDKARAQRARGRALVALARPKEGLVVLDAAAREFRAAGKADLVARVLLDMAYAYQSLDAPGEALRVAVQCDTMLQSGQVVDRALELQVLLYLANAFVRMGDHAAANASAERALEVAKDVGDPATLADLYAGLAITRQNEGDTEAAVTYTSRSLALYEQLGREKAVAEAWNTAAWVAVGRREFRRAKDALDQADALAVRTGHDQLRALILGTRAELALAQGKPQEAVRLADESVAHPHASSFARASASLIRAQGLSASGAPLAKVRAAYEQAVAANAAEPQARRAQVHESYADALAAHGQATPAFEQSKKALGLTRATTPA